MQDELRKCWEEYLAGGDVAALLRYLDSHPETARSCIHEYPYTHRLRDVVLNGRGFRVSRCCRCGEQLFFMPVETVCETEGVPYWLSGERLQAWAHDEDKWPEKGDIDWDQWR